jgi:hypothetical protein
MQNKEERVFIHIGAALIIIVVLLLLVNNPGFRMFALWGVGIVVVLIIILINVGDENSRKESARQARQSIEAANNYDVVAGCHEITGYYNVGSGAWPYKFPPCVGSNTYGYTNVPTPVESQTIIKARIRAVEKQAHFITAANNIDSKFGCHMPLGPLDATAPAWGRVDKADDPGYWQFNLPWCDASTQQQISAAWRHEWEIRQPYLAASWIEDIDAVDVEVGCHQITRSGFIHEPNLAGTVLFNIAWPNNWPYKFPPCAATTDGTFKPVVDVRQTKNAYR